MADGAENRPSQELDVSDPDHEDPAVVDSHEHELEHLSEDLEAEHAARRKGTWRGVEASRDAYIFYDFSLRILESKIQALVLGSELRFYALFLIMFCFFFLLERDITDNYFLAKAFKDPLLGSEIAKIKIPLAFPAIAEASHFNDWLVDVFLTQTIDPTYPTGAQFLVGAFRLRTQRVRDDSCDINHAIIPKSMPKQALKCYGHMSSSTKDTGTGVTAYNAVGKWQYKSCKDWGHGSVTTGQMARYDCGGFYVTVPWWRPVTDIAEADSAPFPSKLFERVPRTVAQNMYILPVLENDPPFIDNLATRFVTVEFFAYQPTLETFFSFKLFGEQAAGGLWHTQYQARVFAVWTASPAHILKTVYDSVFAAFVLYYVYRFIADFLLFKRKEQKILGFFFNTWNLLEVTNIAIFLVVFGFRVAWILKCSSTDLDIKQLVYTDRYPAELDDILTFYMFQIYLNAINTVLSFLKLLKFFRLNDRLNVLTRTLAESQDSIIGVLLIFFLVVTAFALTGHGLFGLGVWAFRSIDASYSTLLLMLVGQFDYEAMKNENRLLAGFFFWAFMILGQFCLLNFLIGVLMEAFAEVSKSKSILPLETVLVKSFEDLKRVCHPENLKRTVTSICRESRADLLELALESVKLYRLELFPDDTEEMEEKQLISRAILVEALSDDLLEKIGDRYIDYVWNDLVYEWDQSESAQGAVDAQRDLILTARGVRAAIGGEMDMLEALPTRLQVLEADLARVAALVDAKGGLAKLQS